MHRHCKVCGTTNNAQMSLPFIRTSATAPSLSAARQHYMSLRRQIIAVQQVVWPSGMYHGHSTVFFSLSLVSASAEWFSPHVRRTQCVEGKKIANRCSISNSFFPPPFFSVLFPSFSNEIFDRCPLQRVLAFSSSHPSARTIFRTKKERENKIKDQ